MKFAIFGNTYQAKKSSHAVTLFKLLKKQGAEIGMCREFYPSKKRKNIKNRTLRRLKQDASPFQVKRKYI